MKRIRGIVVCVGYADLLKITLPRNMQHLDECLVVTSPNDEETKEFCRGIPNVSVYETDAFYRFGANFNKGMAMEEGFDILGRHGWILIWDADTLFPDYMSDMLSVDNLKIGTLYGPPRLILKDPSEWTPEFNWDTARKTLDRCWPGYFQLFHADDPHITQLPWYDVTFRHAGGGDGYFEARWKRHEKVKLPFVVLHLGERDANWFGRASKRADGAPIEGSVERRAIMEEYLASKGWGRPWSGKSFEDHVQVPDAQPSGFRLLGAGDQ